MCARWIIKSCCVLLCTLRVIGSIVPVNTYRDHRVRVCGSPRSWPSRSGSLHRAALSTPLNIAIVIRLQVQYATRNFEIRQTIRENLFFFLLPLFPCFLFFFFAFAFAFCGPDVYDAAVATLWWKRKMSLVNSKQRWIFTSGVYMSQYTRSM